MDKKVTAISSKSYVHRLIIAAALYGRGVCIVTNILSKDMEATVGVVNALGADVCVEEDNDRYLIKVNRPMGENHMDSCTLDCGESGSTARFILPIAPVIAKNVTVTGSGRLPERPMGPLCVVLREAGVDVSSDYLPITLTGRPAYGEYEIAGNVSSQYITGLLFALPLLDGPSKLKIVGNLESAAYVDMTVEVLQRFGVDVKREGNRFYVNQSGEETAGKNYVNQENEEISGEFGNDISRYVNQNNTRSQEISEDEHVNITAEGDWSNAAYMMAIGALGSGRAFDSLTIEGLGPDSIQGDRAVVDIFMQFGINVTEADMGEGGILASYTVSGYPTHVVDVDCSQIPDLVPALAAVAAYADGDSVFRNVGRLRIKECDRIDGITKMLAAVGTEVTIETDGRGRGDKPADDMVNITPSPNGGELVNITPATENMIVHGKGGRRESSDITIDSMNDHRIAMAAAALSFAEDAHITITDPQAVKKSYPGFFETLAQLKHGDGSSVSTRVANPVRERDFGLG